MEKRITAPAHSLPMFLRQFKESSMANMSYIVADETTGKGVVIDPTGDTQRILKAIFADGLKIEFVLITHSHPDHTSGIKAITSETGAKVAAHRSATGRKDVAFDDGAVLKVGSLDISVIHTPGHTKDSICFLVNGRLFTGDTLFVGECGRANLPGGDAGALYDSFFNKLLKLPDVTEIYPGHDYGPKPTSTIGYERKNNYTLQPRSKEEFIEFMAED